LVKHFPLFGIIFHRLLYVENLIGHNLNYFILLLIILMIFIHVLPYPYRLHLVFSYFLGNIIKLIQEFERTHLINTFPPLLYFTVIIQFLDFIQNLLFKLIIFRLKLEISHHIRLMIYVLECALQTTFYFALNTDIQNLYIFLAI